MSQLLSIIQISESMELPITVGTIKVDTSANGVTLFMKQSHKHIYNDTLTITKISNDNNPVSLLSDTASINNLNIVVFGASEHLNSKTITMKCEGTNWNIIHTE